MNKILLDLAPFFFPFTIGLVFLQLTSDASLAFASLVFRVPRFDKCTPFISQQDNSSQLLT